MTLTLSAAFFSSEILFAQTSVFSKTAEFRRESISAVAAAIQQLGIVNNFMVDTAEDAGNFGWPYCITNNIPNIDYYFTRPGTSGSAFDCDNPINDSPNNSGAAELPATKSAWIWYPYGQFPEFPEITAGYGRTAMAGPVYYFKSDLTSEVKLPEYYNNTLYIYECSRNWIKEVKLDSAGNILKINPFLNSMDFIPMDLEMEPDGAIYMLKWGSDFFGGNSDSRLSRIIYKKNKVPVIQMKIKIQSRQADSILIKTFQKIRYSLTIAGEVRSKYL